MLLFNSVDRKVRLFTKTAILFNITALVFQGISWFVRENIVPYRWKFDRNVRRSISKQQE